MDGSEDLVMVHDMTKPPEENPAFGPMPRSQAEAMVQSRYGPRGDPRSGDPKGHTHTTRTD